MADSTVSFFLNNLSKLLQHEAKLLCGVEDKIISLQNELELINAVLKTSERKKSKREIEQTVLNQIRDVAHVAEDVIDKFIANVATYEKRSVLGKMLRVFNHARLLRDVAGKIDKTRTNFNEIRENRIKYMEFQEGEESTAREDGERVESLHKRRRNVEEDDVVGFVHDAEEVIKRLVEGGLPRGVISIIGMGGLGKTTLARKVNNSNEVKQQFDVRLWVYASNECKTSELLLSLVEQLLNQNQKLQGLSKDEVNEMIRKSRKQSEKQKEIETEMDQPRHICSLSEEELKAFIRKHLKRKRYLIVLDDLWKTQDWDEVQDVFPNKNKGSRILITSRLKKVATHTSRDPPYHLPFLSEEESWELFSKKVFRGEEYPSNLVLLGKQLVEGCQHLPLSIVVLAGLLANKDKSHKEWSKVVGHVNSYLVEDETRVKDVVLKLSYDNLPGRLKPFFLYLGIFPKDFEIPVRPLLQQWVAEGFIQNSGDRDPDDVAEDYLHELIGRSLVQVSQVKTSGGVKICRIHDLLRELCIFESKKDKVFEVCTVNNILTPTKPRRLSIHCGIPRYVSSNKNDHSCVRSLFNLDNLPYEFTRSEWKWVSKVFKIVRVLDLGRNLCKMIPSQLGDFIHLRYLRIELGYQDIDIPTCICFLRNLLTLDLGKWHKMNRISLPKRMWKLQHLRHLYTNRPIMLQRQRSEIDDKVMWNLQTISCIALNSQTTSLIEKGMFPKLRNLGLHFSADHDGELSKLLLTIQQLSHLNKLQIVLQTKDYKSPSPLNLGSMEWNIGCRPQELLQSLEPFSHLSALKVFNALDLLLWSTFPPNITKLTLVGISCLNDEGINALGNLTKLRILRLSGGIAFLNPYSINCLGGFPTLEVFQMRDLTIQNWTLANGAMPRLHSLVIDKCHWLDDLPNELWSLTTLKVQVRRPSQALALLLKKLKMKDGCKIIVE